MSIWTRRTQNEQAGKVEILKFQTKQKMLDNDTLFFLFFVRSFVLRYGTCNNDVLTLREVRLERTTVGILGTMVQRPTVLIYQVQYILYIIVLVRGSSLSVWIRWWENKYRPSAQLTHPYYIYNEVNLPPNLLILYIYLVQFLYCHQIMPYNYSRIKDDDDDVVNTQSKHIFPVFWRYSRKYFVDIVPSYCCTDGWWCVVSL